MFERFDVLEHDCEGNLRAGEAPRPVLLHRPHEWSDKRRADTAREAAEAFVAAHAEREDWGEDWHRSDVLRVTVRPTGRPDLPEVRVLLYVTRAVECRSEIPSERSWRDA